MPFGSNSDWPFEDKSSFLRGHLCLLFMMQLKFLLAVTKPRNRPARSEANAWGCLNSSPLA